MNMIQFKNFLLEKGKENNKSEIGKDVIVFGNIKGTIIGIQEDVLWIKVKGQPRFKAKRIDCRII